VPHIGSWLGLASTLAELKQLGYEATGITPEPAQAKHAKEHWGADMRWFALGLSIFPRLRNPLT